MKKLSTSDVITNSSTETFLLYDKDGMEKIKETVTSILQLTSDYTFDDFFTLELDLEDYIIEELWESENPNKSFTEWRNSISQEEFEKWVWEQDNQRNYEEGFLVTGYSIKVNPGFEDVEKLQKIVKYINGLDSLFDMDSQYC